jgi:hypothetical protein
VASVDANGYCTPGTTVPVLVTVNAFVDESVNGVAFKGNRSCVCPAVIAKIFVPELCVNANADVGGVNAPV